MFDLLLLAAIYKLADLKMAERRLHVLRNNSVRIWHVSTRNKPNTVQ